MSNPTRDRVPPTGKTLEQLGERNVLNALEDCLSHTPGSWRVTVAGMGTVAHHWLLDIVRLEDGASGRVLVNERSSDPAGPLRRVLAAFPPAGTS